MSIYYLINKARLIILILSISFMLGDDLNIVVGKPNTENFPEICFGISVKDYFGNKVENLDTSMVTLYEDSVRNMDLTFKTLAESGEHISILISVDASLSMRGEPIERVKSAIKRISGYISNNFQVGILAFHDDIEIICDFTNSKSTLNKKVDSIEAVGKKTALHYGLIKSLELLKEAPGRHKALIVFSDGKDEGAAYSDDDAIEKAKKYSIPIFSIGYRTIVEKKYLRVLERMADKTGGQYNDAQSTEQIEDVYDAAFVQIQAQQTICFESNESYPEISEHMVNINISAPSGDGNKSLVYISPSSGKDKPKLYLLFIGIAFLLMFVILIYINKKNKQKSETEKQSILDEKEKLEKELQIEKEAKIAQKNIQDEKFDPKKTQIGGSRATQLQIYFENGPLSGQTEILTNAMSIGRHSSNTVVIAEQTVSNQHAKIEYRETDFFIIDLNSTNGIKVNDKSVSECTLKQGDEVQLGKIRIAVK